MMAAAVLSRALWAPKGAAPVLASLASRHHSWSGHNSSGSFSWNGAFAKDFGLRSSFSAGYSPLSTDSSSYKADRDNQQGRPWFSSSGPLRSPPLAVFGTGAYNIAGDPFSSGSSPTGGVSGSGTAVNADPSGGGGFALLAAAHATLAVTAFMLPTAFANTFFPGAALPQGMQSQALVKLLGCGLGAGAAANFALKQCADGNALGSPLAQRLQLGLMAFSSGAIALHLLYSPSITVMSLLSGAAVMGTTFAVPYQTYRKAVGPVKPTEVLGRYVGAVPDHLRIKNVQSALYSVLTPTLALAGLSYLFFPGSSLAAAFGYAKDTASFFFWQNIGGGLATVVPALTYSLKTQADAGRLADPISKTLNFGLLAASLGHLAVLYPMVAAGQGGQLLPWIMGAWAAGAGTGLLGLMSGGATTAAGKV